MSGKSIEPTAARLRVVEQGTEDYEQASQQFLNQSPWDAKAVRDGLQTWIARQVGTDGALILDDTGFPKQGTHSVGVARQYTGTLVKSPVVRWQQDRADQARPIGHNLQSAPESFALVANVSSIVGNLQHFEFHFLAVRNVAEDAGEQRLTVVEFAHCQVRSGEGAVFTSGLHLATSAGEFCLARPQVTLEITYILGGKRLRHQHVDILADDFVGLRMEAVN